MIRGALASTRSLSGALASTRGGTGTPWYRAGGAPLPIAVYEAKGAASLAASYVNVVNPGTFNAAPGVAPTWSGTTGWGFSGTQNLVTGLIPVNDQTWAVLVRFSDTTGDGDILICAIDAALGKFILIQPRRGGTTVGYASGGIASKAPVLDAGVLAIAGNKAYRNGVEETAVTLPASAGTLQQFRIGMYDPSLPALNYVGNIQYIAIWDTSTGHATWMPAVSAACAAL